MKCWWTNLLRQLISWIRHYFKHTIPSNHKFTLNLPRLFGVYLRSIPTNPLPLAAISKFCSQKTSGGQTWDQEPHLFVLPPLLSLCHPGGASVWRLWGLATNQLSLITGSKWTKIPFVERIEFFTQWPGAIFRCKKWCCGNKIPEQPCHQSHGSEL